MRILAIDPGAKRLGIALSDETATIAMPLMVIQHVSRIVDAAAIAKLADENNVGKIIVGQSLDEDGLPTLEGRRAARLAAAIRTQTAVPVELWDESFSTQDARTASQLSGLSATNASTLAHASTLAQASTLAHASTLAQCHKRGHGHRPRIRPRIVDDLAAAVILQSYLDTTTKR